MAKLVLHIGTHKTATTTIQDMFHANAPLLEQHGLIYPRLGRNKVTGHHGLVYDWGRLPPVFKLDVSSLNALGWINREYAHREGTVLLSSEEFSRGDPERLVDFAAVRDSLSGFESIEVICVLRPQWQFLQSVYLELSKSKSPPRPPRLVESALETGMFQGLWIDYNMILDRLEQFFAPTEITLMDFEAARRAEGGIIGSMLRHLGTDLEADALEKVNGGASNVSPQPLATWVSSIMTEPVRAPDWLLAHATQAFEDECDQPLRPCLFTQSEFKRLKDHFAVLNARLEERRAPYQPGFRMAVPDGKPITLYRNQVNSAIWSKLARFLVMDRIRAEQAAAKANRK